MDRLMWPTCAGDWSHPGGQRQRFDLLRQRIVQVGTNTALTTICVLFCTNRKSNHHLPLCMHATTVAHPSVHTIPRQLLQHHNDSVPHDRGENAQEGSLGGEKGVIVFGFTDWGRGHWRVCLITERFLRPRRPPPSSYRRGVGRRAQTTLSWKGCWT